MFWYWHNTATERKIKWNEKIDRRLQRYLEKNRENPNNIEDSFQPENNFDEPTRLERNPVRPVSTFTEPNKPSEINPWKEVITEWNGALMDDYRDLFTDTDSK